VGATEVAILADDTDAGSAATRLRRYRGVRRSYRGHIPTAFTIRTICGSGGSHDTGGQFHRPNSSAARPENLRGVRRS